MFKNIIVAIDLSEINLSKPALDQAAELARQSGGAVRLVNVQTLLPATFMDYVPADFDQQMKDNAEASLRKVADQVDLPKERISCVVRVGGVYPEILAEADERAADLIVVGSHRPAMSTYLLGSNAKTIVRHAKCSVLVVRV
ncbi:MAG: universal stress protein [Beijerinckiaceae bacterium]|nr:universal stress protein [Beijerinckiaceae bacterium]MDO9441497.1 universal stress protein [Beijerinckiaceae bacterium]